MTVPHWLDDETAADFLYEQHLALDERHEATLDEQSRHLPLMSPRLMRLAELYRADTPLREIAAELGYPNKNAVSKAVKRLRDKGIDMPPRYGRKPYVEEDRGYETPCWIWQKSLTRLGYGHVSVAGQMRPAHRVFYERSRGPILKGLVIDHLCRVPACVNPNHLEAVTHAENCRRGAKARLTKAQIKEIRASQDSDRRIAERLGVSRRTVQKVRTGETWAGVEDGAIPVQMSPHVALVEVYGMCPRDPDRYVQPTEEAA